VFRAFHPGEARSSETAYGHALVVVVGVDDLVAANEDIRNREPERRGN